MLAFIPATLFQQVAKVDVTSMNSSVANVFVAFSHIYRVLATVRIGDKTSDPPAELYLQTTNAQIPPLLQWML